MEKVKGWFLALSCVMAAGTVCAQDVAEVSVSGDVVSSYIWRGCKLDDAAVQPTLGVAYKGISLSAWGSYGIVSKVDTWKELDLNLTYSAGNFHVGVTDYWLGSGRYLDYRKGETTHIWEGNIGYDFGSFSIQWYTNFAGADAVNGEGKRAYTSYAEVNAPFKLGGVDWNATVGLVPFDADNGFYEANSQNLAVTNVSLKACKELKVTDSFSVPVFAQLVANPSVQSCHLVFGFTLR